MQFSATLACMLAATALSWLPYALAWKPIVGTSFSSTYNLAQPHASVSSGKTLSIGADLADSAEYGATLLQEPAAKLFKSAASAEAAPIGGALRGHAAFANYEDERFGYNHAEQHELFGGALSEDQCAVKKYAFNHDGIVKYDNDLPELNQFTICYWMRFTNHSGDHVVLTYSVKDEARQIQFWIANAKNSSFISMAIKGQQVYRLNYPLRVRQWHHQCSSWNGKTGEWQVWLKAERIGRGFHNALVGHKIPANGKLYSGGASVTGEISEGLHFEVTLVQIYRIALSAGKAHRDHKHHHAHTFDHEGQELSSTTRAPPAINRPLPMHSLLASGQLPARVRLNLAQPQQAPSQTQLQYGFAQQAAGNDKTVFPLSERQAVTINTNFVNGQINAGSRLVAQQLLAGTSAHLQRPTVTQTSATTHEYSTLNNPANVQFIDETETRIFFKRQVKSNDTKAKPTKVLRKRASVAPAAAAKEKNLKKRGLVLLADGSVVDDALVDADYKYDGLAEFGGQQFKHDLTLKMNLEDEVSAHDREPAEEEVKAVLVLCSACDAEPFQGAIVFAWKDAKADMDNALRGYSVGGCGNF